MTRGLLHHVELWVTELAPAEHSLGWLLTELGYTEQSRWPTGVSYGLGGTYVVLESGPDLTGDHERCQAGLNHLAFHAGTRAETDALTVAALDHGWSLLFADRHPFAGGADTYAAYLENAAGFEVELVAEAT